jgi:hypothetical protein
MEIVVGEEKGGNRRTKMPPCSVDSDLGPPPLEQDESLPILLRTAHFRTQSLVPLV